MTLASMANVIQLLNRSQLQFPQLQFLRDGFYGMGTLANYAARRGKKRLLYQDAYPGRDWEWDVQQDGRLQDWLRRHPLPAAIPSWQRQ